MGDTLPPLHRYPAMCVPSHRTAAECVPNPPLTRRVRSPLHRRSAVCALLERFHIFSQG